MISLEEKIPVIEIRRMLNNASSIEEIKKIRDSLPKLSEEENKRAQKLLDDGIYDENGILIGEKHPDDWRKS